MQDVGPVQHLEQDQFTPQLRAQLHNVYQIQAPGTQIWGVTGGTTAVMCKQWDINTAIRISVENTVMWQCSSIGFEALEVCLRDLAV